MKESISYTFILNIVILFVFTCAAIIMGIFSYYRAFKASRIIIGEIEKYEGYNCISENAIAQKLNTISYNVPFKVRCKTGDKNCKVDTNSNYAVVSYNLDYSSGQFISGSTDIMNTQYTCTTNTSCKQTKQYQYGVYTYMYIDVPVISNIIRIPLFSKTSIMYEFRDIMTSEVLFESVGGNHPYDLRSIPSELHDEANVPEEYKVYNELNDSIRYTTPNGWFSKYLLTNYARTSVIGNNSLGLQAENPVRLFYQMDINGDGKSDPNDSSNVPLGYDSSYYECGTIRDYSLYK